VSFIRGVASEPLRVQQGGLNHVHLWEGNQHHQFTIPAPVYDTDESQEHQRSSDGQHERYPAQGPGAVVAPMAGRVVKIFAVNGTRVKKGDSILVLEAMKMEVISCFLYQRIFLSDHS